MVIGIDNCSARVGNDHGVRSGLDVYKRQPHRCETLRHCFYFEPLVTGSKALSAGPPGLAEILPGTAINVALGIQSFRTRVFRGVELKDHPLRIRNARIGRGVQKPDFFVREPKVYGADVIFLSLIHISRVESGSIDSRTVSRGITRQAP